MAKRKPTVADIEVLAAEARQKRIQACIEEVQKVLEKHKCRFELTVGLPGQEVPLRAVLNLPASVSIISV